MKTLVSILTIFVLTACAPKPQEPCGYIENSLEQRVSLKFNLPLKMWIDPSFPPKYYQTVQNAMTTWNYGANRLIFALQGVRSLSTPDHQDQHSTIYWQATGWDYGPNLEALTHLAFYNDIIYDADIVFNAQWFTYTTSSGYNDVDVESVLLHELGHSLGLKHEDSILSVMNTYLEPGQIRRFLYPIDIEHLKCEY